MKKRGRMLVVVASAAVSAAVLPAAPVVSAPVGCDLGFESGADCWFLYGEPNSPDSPAVRITTGAAHSGDGLLAVCQNIFAQECSGNAAQHYSVPDDVTSATLSFWFRLESSDSGGTCDDTVSGAVIDPSGPLGVQSVGVLRCSNDVSAESGWQELTVDVTGFLQERPGDVVFFVVGGTSEYTNPELGSTPDESPSTWYIDDVTLDVHTSTYARVASLSLSRHVIANGIVSPAADHVPGACWADVRVLIQRRTSDGWRVVARTRTEDDGLYRIKLERDRPGKYRIKLPSVAVAAGEVCTVALSSSAVHKH